MDLGLEGKSALVTGSYRGTGAGIARVLAGEGVRVFVHGLEPGQADAGRVVLFMRELDEVFGFLDDTGVAYLDSDIEELIRQRDAARADKDFAQSDRIRDELKARGIEIIDTPQGTRWKR